MDTKRMPFGVAILFAVLIVMFAYLTGCSMKTISKNCIPVGNTEYSMCDTLNGLGK